LITTALNPNPLIAPLAIVLIGGLISSTILSRIVTQVMYRLIPPQIEEKITKSNEYTFQWQYRKPVPYIVPMGLAKCKG